MGDTIEKAVERVVVNMHDNLGEPITVDDMARVAMFSKFHFTRIFQRVTGVSPGRFLSALRLQQAKRLLISTSLNVADISMRVGYNSVGTFSARFSRSVGLSPTAYRRMGGFSQILFESSMDREATGVVSGRVLGPLAPGLVFVGLFPTRMPEGRPARCTILREPGPYRLEKVPAGTWYLLSQAVPSGDEAPCVAAHGPIEIGQDTVIETADLHLAPMRILDPPVLLALLDARSR